MVPAASSPSLEVRRSRSRAIVVWLIAGVLLVIAAIWWVTHPAALPTSGEAVSASAPAGGTVYVGIYSSPAPDGRTLSIDEVAVPTENDLGDGISTLICRDGAFSVTADPTAFCRETENAEGATLEPGDTLVVSVSSDIAVVATVGPASVSYREGLQWGTDQVGPPISVTFRAR